MNIPRKRTLTQSLNGLLALLFYVSFLAFGCNEENETNDTSLQGGVMGTPSQGGVTSEPSPSPMTALAERPFDSSAVSSMLYTCVDADEYRVHVQLSAQGALTLVDDIDGAGASFSGTYSLSGQTITLNIPALGAPEVARDQTVVFGLLGAFVTTNLYCFAVALDASVADPVPYTCPLSNHIPDVSYEENEFRLRANGNVFWMHWTNLVEANDRLSGHQNGMYVQEGNQIGMFFGSPFFEPRVMTGTLINGALLIDQLDTNNGACQ